MVLGYFCSSKLAAGSRHSRVIFHVYITQFLHTPVACVTTLVLRHVTFQNNSKNFIHFYGIFEYLIIRRKI